MHRLKTVFASNSGQFLHVGIVVILSILSVRHFVGLVLLFAELLYLWKNSRFLMILSILISTFMIFNYINRSRHQDEVVSNKQVGVITDVNSNFLVVKINREKWYVYHNLSNTFSPGDYVEIVGYPIQNSGYNIPHNFNYQDYLLGLDIEQTFFATKIEVIHHRFHINQLKSSIQKYFINITDDEDTSQIILLLLFGDDTYLNSDVSDAILMMGITHLFVISGMHVGLIVAMIKKLLTSLQLTIIAEEIIIILFLILYTFLCGFSISVIRSSLLIILIFLSKNTKILISKIDILSIILIFFLVINPYMIHLVSFQLSFLLTFVILLLGDRISSDIEVVQLGKVALITSLFGLPIILEINGGINIFVVPMSIFFGVLVAKIILPGMFISLFIQFCMPAYRLIIRVFLSLIKYGNQFTHIIEFNFSNDYLKVIYWMIIMYILVSEITFKRILISFIGIIFLILVTLTINHLPLTAYIRVIDVGQGDAIHLHDSNCDILIDTGVEDKYNRVISYFKKSNIHQLDYLILTHRHDDHFGEAIDIQTELNVDNILSSPEIPRVSSANLIRPNLKDEMVCGNFNINIIHYSNQEVEENNNSIVLTVEIFEHKWLFTGDIEASVETKLKSPNLDDIEVVKVSHHGSITSSIPEFVNRIQPEYAIISVGKNNQYKHPSIEVINRWESVGSIVLRTDLSGTIEFKYIGKNYQSITDEVTKKEAFHYFKRK